MPISAPNPNSPPSTNREEAFTSTAAASTSATNRSAAGSEDVTIVSEWPVVWARMCSTASSSDATTRQARSSDRYSPSNSSGPAGTTASENAHTSGVPWTVTPASASAASARGRKLPAMSACTSSVSQALQTLGRCTLALSRIASAISSSADAST